MLRKTGLTGVMLVATVLPATAQEFRFLPMVGDYMIARSAQDKLCIASLSTKSVNGTPANLSYYQLEGDPLGMIYMGLKPDVPAKPAQDRISVQIDGVEQLFGNIAFDPTGKFELPVKSEAEFSGLIEAMDHGKQLVLLFDKRQDAIQLDLLAFQEMRAGLVACLKGVS
ncbi:hypothetical protein [Phaeovulum sp. W22_SRMD_FR3]|uniref:hypothetical protein n=1 Tax=Phaeovulum sp. W22_SRMD_FR3 TaxID=3240274 RepID=UPI003F94AF13